MRGTTLLRPQTLVFAGTRVGGRGGFILSTTPTSKKTSSSSSRSGGGGGICLLCRYNHTFTTPTTILRQILPIQQRRATSSARTSVENDNNNNKQIGNSGPITPDVTNHYTLFPSTLPKGAPPQSSFEIDTAALRREFLKLQNAIHPDKFPQGAEKQRAEALSSRINEAYRTLADPLSRAQYLLAEFHGIDVLAEDGLSSNNKKYVLDSETLMEVMEVQETVEELSSTNVPVTEAESVVARLREANAERIEASVRKLVEAFDHADIDTAQMETVRLRFWYSLRDGLKEWEPGHGEIRIVH